MAATPGRPNFDPGSYVRVGTFENEAFVAVLPPLADEEVKVLEWAGIITAEQVSKMDETGDLVALEESSDSLEENIHTATLKAAEIVATFNRLKIREEITVMGAALVDFTPAVNA